ncbi:MAG: 4Fe-4S binding protein [Proteobacteria bacterium]|nr:4Fe-4S binding protein [Pseudomonadota bacterium]
MKDVYEDLRARLDDFASGYPGTESGVEIRILKTLFTREEAVLFLNLTPLLESPPDVAARLNRDPAETAELLERMARKGLLFRLRSGDAATYAVVAFVPGIYDFQVNRMDRAFARDVNDYTEQGFGRTIQAHATPIMRTIPIDRDLVLEWPIAPYDDAMKIIADQEVIALALCICRTKSGLLDESCGKPLETCLMFGAQAHFYVDNQMARFIDKEEAKRVIRQSDEAGLVLQPFNSQKMGVMCSCCGDCCEMLGSLKRQPVPAASVKSNYFASVDAIACTGCDICIDRCQMEAITALDHGVAIDLDRCIGCGLCVTTCSAAALRLEKKADPDQYQPPKSGAETYMLLARERNKRL